MKSNTGQPLVAQCSFHPAGTVSLSSCKIEFSMYKLPNGGTDGALEPWLTDSSLGRTVYGSFRPLWDGVDTVTPWADCLEGKTLVVYTGRHGEVVNRLAPRADAGFLALDRATVRRLAAAGAAITVRDVHGLSPQGVVDAIEREAEGAHVLLNWCYSAYFAVFVGNAVALDDFEAADAAFAVERDAFAAGTFVTPRDATESLVRVLEEGSHRRAGRAGRVGRLRPALRVKEEVEEEEAY